MKRGGTPLSPDSAFLFVRHAPGHCLHTSEGLWWLTVPTWQEAGAQRGEAVCPRSHSWRSGWEKS